MPVILLSFDPLKLQLAMLAAAVSAIGAGARIWIAGWINSQIGLSGFLKSWRFEVVLPLWIAIALFLVYRLWTLLNGDHAALRATEQGLEVRTFLKHRIVPWHALLHSQAITNWYGPHRRKSFNIRYAQDGATHSLRVPVLLVARPVGGLTDLPDRIEKAQAAALGRGPSAGGAFDPDAAIRRYLDGKKASAAAPLDAAAAVPPLQPAPARPTFGRRATPPRTATKS